MPRVAVVVLLVLGLAVPAAAVMPPPMRLALLFERVPWSEFPDVDPRPAWQIAFDWSPGGSHR